MIPVDIQRLHWDDAFFSNLERWGNELHAQVRQNPDDEWRMQDYESFLSIMRGIRSISDARRRGETQVKLNPVDFRVLPNSTEYLKMREGKLWILFKREKGEWILNQLQDRNGTFLP